MHVHVQLCGSPTAFLLSKFAPAMGLYWIVIYWEEHPGQEWSALSAFPFQSKRSAERFSTELRRRDLRGKTIKDDDPYFDAWRDEAFQAWVDKNFHVIGHAGPRILAAEIILERGLKSYLQDG